MGATKAQYQQHRSSDEFDAASQAKETIQLCARLRAAQMRLHNNLSVGRPGSPLAPTLEYLRRDPLPDEMKKLSPDVRKHVERHLKKMRYSATSSDLGATTTSDMAETRESCLAGCEQQAQILRETSMSCVRLTACLEDMTNGMDCRSADLLTETIAIARYHIGTCQSAVTSSAQAQSLLGRVRETTIADNDRQESHRVYSEYGEEAEAIASSARQASEKLKAVRSILQFIDPPTARSYDISLAKSLLERLHTCTFQIEYDQPQASLSLSTISHQRSTESLCHLRPANRK